MKRVIIIVLDSLGIGASLDADKFNDTGTNTLKSIIKAKPKIKIDNLKKLGLFLLPELNKCLNKYSVDKETDCVIGSYGSMQEAGESKDTIAGHWELMGVIAKEKFNTYPNGFPKEFIEEFQSEIGRKVIGNKVASGTEILDELGKLHEDTGFPIVYTSADSVFQIAVNTEIIPLEELYFMCEKARRLLVGKWNCGRVIARPYEIVDGKRVRTSYRRDYSVNPPKETLLDILTKKGIDTFGVGKIKDIFNGNGVKYSCGSKTNLDGINKTIEIINSDFKGLLFTNLVDFDSLYGHRRDAIGYAEALEDFDIGLGRIIASLKEDDILFITADHGNDPSFTGFNHTREDVPILIYGINIKENIYIGKRLSFSDLAKSILDYFEIEDEIDGNSFLIDIVDSKENI